VGALVYRLILRPLIVTNELEMRTLPIGLNYRNDNEGNTAWGTVMAGSLIVSAPVSSGRNAT
jgi:sn-glycerol 3-phosphate transport system permease protein